MKRLLGIAVFALAAIGCGRPFDVKPAPGFVALEHQQQHDWRATTPEGVVMAVRVVDDEDRGDLAFWTQAITLQMRDVSGYALLSSADVVSADGTKGKRLEFGHDEDNKPYVYWVSIFPAQGRLFLVESGGSKETFEKAKPSIEWMHKTLHVRCNGFLSPVFSSRTCNRW